MKLQHLKLFKISDLLNTFFPFDIYFQSFPSFLQVDTASSFCAFSTRLPSLNDAFCLKDSDAARTKNTKQYSSVPALLKH